MYDTQARRHEHATRLGQIRALLEARGSGAAFLTKRPNVSWLTAGAAGHIDQSAESSVAAILVTRNEAIVLTQNIEAARWTDEEVASLGIEVVPVPWWEPDAIGAEARRRVAAGSTLTRDEDLESDLSGIRSVLSDFDRARMADLGREAAAAMDATVRAARAGMTENELASELVGRLPGSRAPVVLVAADERIARYRHPLPTDTPIRARVMVVIVAERWGLHVALTRLRELEAPAPDLARRIEAVRAVQTAMHGATRPGATFGEVFEAARSSYAHAGYPDEWRHHHQGGSIAYKARERVAIPSDPTVIKAGMALAWNPSIAGAKAEDTIVVPDAGPAVVITPP